MCSFRDAVAASFVLLARARAVTSSFPLSAQWMDGFSIFPWMLARDHKHIVCQTPAVRGLHNVESFRGQSSPELVCRSLTKGDLDQPLFNTLRQKWREVYLDGSTAHADIALFRSLNMAFRAGSIPAGADATDYDYGRSIALWVSAFEILAHPGGSGKADLFKVYDLFETAPYESAKLSDAVHTAYDKRARPAQYRNLACWLFGEIYRARNDFLHGNPLPPDRMFIKGSGQHMLNYVAPLYRVALSAALGIRWTSAMPPESNTEAVGRWISEKMKFLVPQQSIESALITGNAAPTGA
jgi:hypothetical protein